ncbi:MAG: hypothetical protein J1E06_01380 [Acutalibacter sp.]|nr:hypothetical protein [Acutalibacter sp.]
MYPYIEKANDGKYHLYCGVCRRSNPIVQELPAGMYRMRSIACMNRCSPDGGINQICGINAIKGLAERDGKTLAERAQMIRDVCGSLELDSMDLFSV